VLDPFMGSGTTAIVAERLGRDWLGIELKPEYVAMAMQRIHAERPRREEVMNDNNQGGSQK
jgi:DNA modification methylase